MIDKYSFLFTTGEQYFGWRGTRSPSFQLGCSWYARCCSKPVYSRQELTTPVLDGGELFQWNTLCIRRKSRQALGPDNRFKQETRKKTKIKWTKAKKWKFEKNRCIHKRKFIILCNNVDFVSITTLFLGLFGPHLLSNFFDRIFGQFLAKPTSLGLNKRLSTFSPPGL